jgi:hypothetical protein
MALSVPPGFGLAAFVFSGAQGTQPYVTTLGVDLAAAGGDFVLAANQLHGSFVESLRSKLSPQMRFEKVTLTIGQDGPSGSIDSTQAPVTGTAEGGAYSPSAMSIIARKNTAQYGRAGRGRMFLPGMCPEIGVDENGSVTAQYRAEMQDALDAFFDLLGAPTDPVVPPVLLHSGLEPEAPTPITGFGVAPLVGWIRGRIR